MKLTCGSLDIFKTELVARKIKTIYCANAMQDAEKVLEKEGFTKKTKLVRVALVASAIDGSLVISYQEPIGDIEDEKSAKAVEEAIKKRKEAIAVVLGVSVKDGAVE